jgi:lipopolysaccharide transport system ATP-binding protein
MDEPIISVKNLSKQYNIGIDTTYGTLRDSVTNFIRNPIKAIRSSQKNYDSFWAIKDLNLDIEQGDIVGIIGRNGAGKSTLLKILSRITHPTSGSVLLRGRVGSLLEVGTGFHGELTGRENIYFNGAILGMKHREIEEKFDDIVSFSGVEQFLDTPVKRYSSGMNVRLAFAVAAHLDPEILIVDEVLAVGDAEFQKKCLGKMKDVASTGKTVLFVSHNIAAIQHLCKSSIVLDSGQKIFQGDIKEGINLYLGNMRKQQDSIIADRKDRHGNKQLQFTHVSLYDIEGNGVDHVLSGQDLVIRLHYRATKELHGVPVNIVINVRNSTGVLFTSINSSSSSNTTMDVYRDGYFECVWENFNLRGGLYDCDLMGFIEGDMTDLLMSAFVLNVDDGDFYGTGRLPNRTHGDILVKHSWNSCI